jgi:hypothetical protein
MEKAVEVLKKGGFTENYAEAKTFRKRFINSQDEIKSSLNAQVVSPVDEEADLSDKRDQSSPIQTIGGEMDSQTVSTQETLDSESLLGLNISSDGTGVLISLLAPRVCQPSLALETSLSLIGPTIPLHSLQTSLGTM